MINPLQRNWLLNARIDSRLFLRCLIAFNVVLAVYNLLSLQTNYRNGKSAPCVVVINTNKGHVESQLKAKLIFKENYRFQSSSLPLIKESLNSGVVTDLRADETIGHKYMTDSRIKDETYDNVIEKNIWWTIETRSSYTVIRNFLTADYEPNYNESVTLTTQGTYEFLYHAEQLCQRWDGPLSIAVYAPGDDIDIVTNLIYYMRKCADKCVQQKISWHLVYDSAFGPKLTKMTNVSFPESYLNNMNANCSEDNDIIIEKFFKNFRRKHSLPYPINVVRNVARLSAKTKYILASDIELYPSVNVVSSFMGLLQRERMGLVPLVSNDIPHVYVLPIFEVKEGIRPPMNKSELRTLMKSGNAIFFHKWVCDVCQNFPDRDKWIGNVSINGTLNVFRVAKRDRTRNVWEPLYIGTNAEPLYDERLSWDGKRDKMSQMYEMCLIHYDLAILDNAFLVHAPGIKHIDPKDQRKRLPFIKRNNMVYNTILAKLRKKYGTKNQC